MKYSDVLEQEYSDNIGMVEIMGQTVQLCDHMEEIDGHYYATALCIDIRDRKLLKDLGVQSKHWATKDAGKSDDEYMFFSEKLLKEATPKFQNDRMTQNMIDRLISALEPLNRKPYQHAA